MLQRIQPPPSDPLPPDSINRDCGLQLGPVDRAKCCQQPQSQVEQEKSDCHAECVSPQTCALGALAAPPRTAPRPTRLTTCSPMRGETLGA